MNEKIKAAREKAGLTQVELADKIGVTQGVISRWEIGERVPASASLKKLSAALGCKIDDLI